MAITTTGGNLYIVELEEPNERLEIQFVPENITTPRNANLKSVSIVGRNNDLLQYTGGQETLQMTLNFLADDDLREEVIKKVAWLKSLTMKDGNKGVYRNVKLVMGDLFKNEIWAVSSVEPTLSHLDDEHNYLPLRAVVVVKMILDPKTNLLFSDVRRS